MSSTYISIYTPTSLSCNCRFSSCRGSPCDKELRKCITARRTVNSLFLSTPRVLCLLHFFFLSFTRPPFFFLFYPSGTTGSPLRMSIPNGRPVCIRQFDYWISARGHICGLDGPDGLNGMTAKIKFHLGKLSRKNLNSVFVL